MNPGFLKPLWHKHLPYRTIGKSDDVDAALEGIQTIALQVINFGRRNVGVFADLFQAFALTKCGIYGYAACRCRHGEATRAALEMLGCGSPTVVGHYGPACYNARTDRIAVGI